MRYNSKWRGMTCSVEACDGQAEKRGWCQKHYRRWHRNGTLDVTVIVGDPIARFWSKVEKTDTCWLWLGSHDDKGYGWFKLDNRMQRAHRVAYRLVIGDLADGFELHHECGNESCVNPEHLSPLSEDDHHDRHRSELDPICAVPICERPRLARGLCRTHYERQYQHGDVSQGRLPAAAFRL